MISSSIKIVKNNETRFVSISLDNADTSDKVLPNVENITNSVRKHAWAYWGSKNSKTVQRLLLATEY